MPEEDKKTCPSCGTNAEFILTCTDCGHVFCPWCFARQVDTHKILVSGNLTSCPKCGSDKTNM
ncbi:MAG: hypothetical protein JW883_12425 [Deltaproteobacteria bacterium]|nr:hypothetical protein [Deltaproteobacteria bacterium]